MSAGPIRLISASAGSGKTHRLVDELERAITRERNPVRPEAVIATTFTVKAASELRERVRSRLLESGQVDKAQRLGAARIGTVNAVCAQLVTDFAFELGISPEVQVLDEIAAEQAFGRALSSVVSITHEEGSRVVEPTSEAGAALIELAERWQKLDWFEDVRQIAGLARGNALDSKALEECAVRSLESLLAYFGPAEPDGNALERNLERALDDFLVAPLDETQKTKGVVEFARAAHTRLKARRPLSWWDWAKLASAETGAKSRQYYDPVRVAARGHERHPLLRADLEQCIRHVFTLAARALDAYESYKRAWGLMDFVDQEARALELLARPEVQDILREQVDLVLVDEFQDTSPLQLEIFLALSRLAPQSVWVGDQKQAIYGFRGTDPALMDSAIAALVEHSGREAQETLQYSWRSRAELVRLTSDVFAPAFDLTGIPAERVRLEPAPQISARPDTMGAVIENWVLNTKNKDDDAAALAAAVGELLEDKGVRVRDVLSDEQRRARPGDLAVLCRSNANCARVTQALENAGIRAVRPRTGLMRTPEARLVLAGLRLWVDVRQPLAAAEIGRLLVHPDAADEWLNAVIDAPGAAYANQGEVERIAEAREKLSDAGPLAAFDAVMEAVGAREVCLRWGASAQRLANLDALRALVSRYAGECEIEGEAATVAGLVASLMSLAGEQTDEQATLSREDAVTVGTLHSAKGLEWPITVLHEIDSAHKPTAFGVHVVCDREGFDFGAPLGGRWIRYWPDPYAPQTGTALHDSVRNGPEHDVAARRDAGETLRLLYVGWTRARDRLVLTGRPGKAIGRTLGLLCDRDGKPLLSEPAASCTWAGRPVTVQIRSAVPASPIPPAPEAGLGCDSAGPRQFAPARANISQLEWTGSVGAVEVLGPGLFIQLPVEWAALGSAVHAFIAADRPALDFAERLAMATAMLKHWSVQGAVRPDALVEASGALNAWLTGNWPNAIQHREWPLRMRQEDGTELTGYADLVLMDEESFALVDYKCLAGSREEALAACAKYAGQVGTYAEVIARATGKRPTGCFVHLVAQGVVVPVEDHH
jgi:ATP-dependent helicase/nuclease subunit A